jgi:signal transduction histidine kinase
MAGVLWKPIPASSQQGDKAVKSTIRLRLWAVLIFSMGSMIVIGWLGVTGMEDLKAALNALYVEEFVPTRVIAEANIALVTWNRSIYECTLAEDGQKLQDCEQATMKHKELLMEKLKYLSDMPNLTLEEKNMMQSLSEYLSQALLLWERITDCFRHGDMEQGQRLFVVELRPVIDQMNRVMSTFLEVQEQQVVTVKASTDAQYRKKLKTITSIIVLVLVVALCGKILMAQSIVSSLKEILKGVQEIREGNLDYRITMHTRHEIGQLAEAFNDMAGARKKAMDELQRVNDELEMRVEKRTAELAQANDELRKEVGQRESAEQALRESSDKLKFFAYSVMHDLKSPLIGVHGISRLLTKHYGDSLDERGRLYCANILRACEHLVSFIEKLNVFIATRESPLEVEEVDVQEIIQVVKEEYSSELALRRIKWLPPEGELRIRADRMCLIRAFRNLVGNALKYGGEDMNQIRMGHVESPDCHVLSICDNGAGIREEDRDRIFRAFQRNASSLGVEGIGLGLSIVKEIAERHLGKVWVEADEQCGTVFHLSISKQI